MIIECPRCNLRYDVAHRAPGTRARCRCGASFEVPAAAPEASAGVRCGGCGARNARQARSCGYCGAALETVTCAACFSLNPASYHHCSQCGSSLTAPARRHESPEEETPLQCPRCESETLEAKLLADTLIDQCPGCGGVWLDHEVLDRLLRERSRQAPLRQRLMRMPAPDQDEDGGRFYLRCPECAVFMNRRNPAHRSGIIVDVCVGHGVWFDDRELAVLMHLADSGAELNVGPRPKPLPATGSGPSRSPSAISLPELQTGRRRERFDRGARRRLDLGDLFDLVERFF